MGDRWHACRRDDPALGVLMLERLCRAKIWAAAITLAAWFLYELRRLK
jgi:hypothetical protein